MNLYSYLKISVFLFCPFLLISQEKTGNIVEYFGKEKINDIREGELLHVFDEGLVLPYQQINNESESFPKDAVVHTILQNEGEVIKEGESFGVNYLGEELRWQTIVTDSSHTFNDRRLRSGYLYLEYQSPTSQTVLFDSSGETQVIINGHPHEGDHYDFGYSLLPIELKKGVNQFLLTPGRFSRMRARLIQPSSPILLTDRDLTLPDVLKEDVRDDYLGAVRVVNTTDHSLQGYSLRSTLKGSVIDTEIPTISKQFVAKVPFKISSSAIDEEEKQSLTLHLLNQRKEVVSTLTTSINVKSKANHHKKTFISAIDGSVQYYSVAPSTTEKENQALFLSVHGASVEAVNQANAYKRKDWGTLVAPTNRRPFGFAWEDWGRLDALEVLDDAKEIYQPDPQKIYLTGHSMGGHGTWYLGATYPDRFAAIAPCAGYPDLLDYREGFRKRILENPELATRWGISEKRLQRMRYQRNPTAIETMINRAGNPSRTLKLKDNYLQQGVYILHGENDNVVPTYIARNMREELGKFHPDFTYYEYPDGTHWYGNHSVDWPPIFDFFKQRSIPKSSEIDAYTFSTATPGVSSTSHFTEIYQQRHPFEISKIDVERVDSLINISTTNVEILKLNVAESGTQPEILTIDEQEFSVKQNSTDVYFKKTESNWEEIEKPSLKEKGPHRNGGFKDAFTNNVVLVYATGGDVETNSWYYNRAKFDAEKFWYRANGNLLLVKDSDFNAADYPGRNVVLYGNRDNNSAWDELLSHSPVQVMNNRIEFGTTTLTGQHWGSYFIYPKPGDKKGSVGVVTATGKEGRIAAYANNYLQNGSSFPDFTLFDSSVLKNGIDGVKCTGFFSNSWLIEGGDFVWK